MVGVFIPFVHQVDAHGNPLHHFDVIAGRIFRRKEAETDPVAPPICVIFPSYFRRRRRRLDVDRLPGRMCRKLRFLEIRGDPDIVQRDQRRQRLADATFCPASTLFVVMMPAAGA